METPQGSVSGQQRAGSTFGGGFILRGPPTSMTASVFCNVTSCFTSSTVATNIPDSCLCVLDLLCDPRVTQSMPPSGGNSPGACRPPQSANQNPGSNSPEKTWYDTEKNQCGKRSKGEEDRPRVLLLLILLGDYT